MKKIILFLSISITGNLLFSQEYKGRVGINTSTPASTLDVVGVPDDASILDGIIAPRITGDQLSAKTYLPEQKGALIYATTSASIANLTGQTINVSSEGYYWFDGLVWVKVVGNNGTGITEWFLKATSNDALGDKTNNISRNGYITVGENSETEGKTITLVNQTSVHPATSPVGINNLVNNDGSGATSVVGFVNGVQNNSSDTSLATLFGQSNGIVNNTSKLTNLRGISTSVTNSASAGAFTSGFGQYTSLVNNSTNTGNISNMTGAYVTNTNNGASNIVSGQTGLTVQNLTGAGSSVGIPTNLNAVVINNNLATQKSGTNSQYFGISLSQLHTSTVNTSKMYGINMGNNVSGSGFVESLSGIVSSVNNGSTGSGTTNDLVGIKNNVTHSSSSNNVLQLAGLSNVLTNTGKTSYINGITLTVDNQSAVSNNVTDQRGIYANNISNSISNDNVDNFVGGLLGNNWQGTGNLNNQYGLLLQNVNSSNSGKSFTNQYGNFIQNTISGNMNILNKAALQVNNTYETGAVGAITNNYGINVNNQVNSTSGSILNNYGVRITHNTTLPNVTNNYALYIDPIGGATQKNYAIYSDGGKSYFRDNIAIGTTNNDEKLTVNGAVTIANGGYAVTANATTPVPNGGPGTIVFYNAHFFGWNGTNWKQLDN